MSSRLRTFVALWPCTLLAMLTACGGGGESPTGADQPGTMLPPNTIGPNGGTLDFAGGNVELVFPSGAVSENVKITVQSASNLPSGFTLVPGTAYDFGPDGIQFSRPVGLTIKYDPARLPLGVQASELRLYTVAAAAWQEVAGSTVNSGNRAVTGQVGGFSVFGILGVPVTTLTVSPATGSIFIGETVQLMATARDAGGRELTERRASWSSSDASVATVTSAGLVTGMGAGSAVISAESEGQSASATFSVTVAVGDLVVTTSTLGVEPDPDGYLITVDDRPSQPIGVNESLTFTDLLVGQHTVRLTGLALNCSADGAHSRTLDVEARGTVQTTFDVSCPKLRFVFETDRDLNREIYVMNADGTEATNLTNNAAADYRPALSPDGTRIAFVSNRDGNDDEIYVMNADGTDPVRLTNSLGADFDPAWSPDGTRIAFVSRRDGNNEIYVMNADGMGPLRLTDNIAIDSKPNWSPDGTRIAFVSNRGGNDDIYIMNADGTGPSRITSNQAADFDPAWSPDGSRMAFVSSRDSNVPQWLENFEFYVMNADGTGPVIRLTDDPMTDWRPAWSPDGSRIAFGSSRSGDEEIYVMNADGTGLLRLTSNPASDTYPLWFPQN